MKRSIPPKPKLMYMITKSHWGGAQKYVYQLATSSLIRKDFDIVVVAGTEGELTEKLRKKGIKACVVPMKNNYNPFSSILELRRLALFIKEEGPGIIHINSSKIALFGAIAAKYVGVKHIIFTAHGFTFTEKKALPLRLLLHFLFYIIVYLSTTTICVAESLKTKLRPPRFLKKKLVTIYNGLENVSVQKLTKLSEGSNVRHIVTIGYIHSNKGQDTVFRLLPFIENIHYHVIGENLIGKSVLDLLQTKKIDSRVTLYGHIENAGGMLSQYDAFLLPSRTEALPYVILEALRAEIPIIARNVGGIPEIVAGVNSAILYNNDNELIDILKNDLPVCSPWKDNRFSIDTMIRKTAFEYQKLLDDDTGMRMKI
jgi:glycosyltransferase involved in cell wall biosynthesis